MDESGYKNVSLDQALLPGADNPLLPSQNIQNAALGGLTIIQQATQANPIVITGASAYDVAAPRDGSFMLAEGTLNASPLLSFQLGGNGTGVAGRAFYDRQVGNIRFFNDSTPSILTVTYQLYRIDGKVGSS